MQSAAQKEWKMMPGSTSGATYLLLGRKGNMAIGIKPTVVMKGDAFGSPGNTWFGSKLRVAPGGKLFEEETSNVVSIGNAQKFDRPKEALPDITWDNDGYERASTTIGVLLKGEPDGNPESMQNFLGQIDNGALAKKMAAYIVQLVGVDHLLISEEEIAEWFDGHYQQIVKSILHRIEMSKKVAEAMEGTMGMVGVQADILKKVYQATGNAHAEDHEDGEDDHSDDDDGDGED